MPGPYPLETLAPTLDQYGITLVAFEDMLASLRAAYQQIYGSDTYLEADSQDGQWLAVQATAFFDLGQALANAYFNFNPGFAQGVGLSTIVKINGIQRQIPTKSNVEVVLVGEFGTLITNGVVRDTDGGLWDLPPSVTIPHSGQITVIATAQVAGQTLAEPNSVIQIPYPIRGWQSVINPASAVPGLPVETDAQLRRRQTRSTAMPAVTPVGGIYGVLANIPGAGRVEIFENPNDFVDIHGIPGHSIACILDGGDPNVIARAIAVKKSPGTGTYGSTSVDTADKGGMPVTINFFYTDRIQIAVEITIIPRVGFVSSTVDLIRQSVALFISEMRTGCNIYRTWLAAPASLAGDAAVEATGLTQFELTQLSETYVLAQILIGTDRSTLDVLDVPMQFMQSGISSVNDIGIVLRQ